MSVLDESVSPHSYFRKEFLSEINPKKTAVKTKGLDIRMFGDDPSDTLGYLSGTMDDLTVEGHATDDPGNGVFDIALKLKAEGPTFNYLGEGIIPFVNKSKNYEYAFPRMTTNGTLTLNEVNYDVTGSSWLDREWGDFDFVTWTWMSMELSNGLPDGRLGPAAL
jgi:hydroxyneurosporene synthase CrtC